jgi:hypothetical protein
MSNTTINSTDQYAEIFEMLLKASKSLKWPSTRFTAVADGTKVSLSLASKGYIAIKLNGEYAGKIMDPNSDMIFYPKNVEALKTEIATFCSFPKYQVTIYGQRFGSCCFCGRELTEKASLYYGYGPVCADKYGLPHELTDEQINLFDVEI